MGGGSRLTTGRDALTAARQAGALFLLAAILAVGALPSTVDRHGPLVASALLDGVAALVAVALPWRRWGRPSTAALALVGCVVLGVSTWAFGGFAAGTGPFFVLLYVWLGLHHTQRVLIAIALPAAAAYVVGLLAADSDAQLVSSTLVLIPIALAVGLVISNRVTELAEARRVIEEQDQWRTTLITTLAHDVRTPLSGVSGALEIMEDDEGLPDSLAPVVDIARRQTSRIASLADNLLDLERIEQGKLRLDLEHVDVADLAQRVAELARPLVVEVDVEPGLEVVADRMRLEEMLVNLTGNAFKHGAPPVEVVGRNGAGAVVLTVRDHGPGVPTDQQEHLFERLGATDGRSGSVGLGLWIVRTLAEAHGGSVCYRTTPEGAEFTLTIPQTPASVRRVADRSR